MLINAPFCSYKVLYMVERGEEKTVLEKSRVTKYYYNCRYYLAIRLKPLSLARILSIITRM